MKLDLIVATASSEIPAPVSTQSKVIITKDIVQNVINIFRIADD